MVEPDQTKQPIQSCKLGSADFPESEQDMYKISHTKVSTGIYKKTKGVYVFRIDRGSTNTVTWRHQKQIVGINDKEAQRQFKSWLEAELDNYQQAKEEFDKSHELANGSPVLTFGQYIRAGTIPADDGQFLTQLKAEATSPKHLGNHRQITNLQTASHLRSHVRILSRYSKLTSKPINIVTPEDIDETLTQLQSDRKLTNNSVNHYLRTISKIFTLAQDAGVVPKQFNPARKVVPRLKQRREKTIITASQYQGVAEALMKLNPIPRAGLLISLLCGLRREELMGLTWGDVDFEHSRLLVRHTLITYANDYGHMVRTIKTGTKNGSVRQVGLPDVVKQALREYWDSLPDQSQEWTDEVTGAKYQLLWQYPNGKELYCMEYFGHMWRKLRKSLIEEGVLTQMARFHDLRGGFITYLLNKEHISPVVVAALAGHKSAKMTLDVYGQADQSDINNALMVLNNALK